MKIVVFGLGYVGATASASLLKDGHRIVGIDVSPGKAAKIGAGQSPVFEPGLEELLSAGRADGRLGAATEVGGHLDDADIAMVCVGTPSMAEAARRYILEHGTWEAHFLTLEAAMIDALRDSASAQNALSSGNGE
jgi:UDP-glucose 6-dehydrogenase